MATRKRQQRRRASTQKNRKEKTFIDAVNTMFQDTMRNEYNPTEHVFFKDGPWWERHYQMLLGDTSASGLKSIPAIYKYSPDADLSTLTSVGDCKYKPTSTLTHKYLTDLYKDLQDPAFKDFKAVRERLHDMSNYNLPTPMRSLRKWKQFPTLDALNIMILGAGPLGLFTALTLQELYNNPYKPIIRKANILLVDNRIHKEGVKAPYSRNTMFGFDIAELQPFFRHIYGWGMSLGGTSTDDPKEVRGFDFINILENLLYTAAYNAGISMAFTKQFEEFDAVQAFVKKEKIHCLFDCTGGRMKTNLHHALQWNRYNMKKGDEEVKLSSSQYLYYKNGTPVKSLVMVYHLFDDKYREFIIGNQFGWPTDKDDIELLETHKNKCYRRDDFMKLNSKFKNAAIRNMLYLIMTHPYTPDIKKIPFQSIKYVKLTTFFMHAVHSPFAATRMDSNCVYIRLGDALVQTEFGIFRGLKTNMFFSKHICNLLPAFL
jgi:hypothetical protein